MGWQRAGVGLVSVALFAAGCTVEADEAVPSTSITIDAPSAVEAPDTIVRYGVPASPTNPWAHYRTSCDTSCGIIFGSITDTLFASSISGETVGLLVETAQTNNDATLHTWRLRDGISFSDGSPLDAQAAKVNIDACRHSALTGPALAGIDDVRAEGLTLTITTLAPWASLAAHFAETPCGHMFSAQWLSSLPDLPMRTAGAPFFDEAIAAGNTGGDPAAPIGLGPFVMVSFEPGDGNSTLMAENPSYWRGPTGITGESLPGIEQIEFVVISDDTTRVAAIESGQFDLVLTSSSESRGRLEAADRLETVSSAAFTDVVHVAMNAAESPTNPLAVVSCRRAISRAIDRESLAHDVDQPVATGPFDPFWVDAAGDEPPEVNPISTFDVEAAGQWATRCVESFGGPVSLRFLAPVGQPSSREVARMIESATGFEIELTEVEPGALAVAAFLGDYDLALWEGFGGVHPDLHFGWWFSDAAAPVGSFATNVGRIQDPALDRGLVSMRRSESVLETARAMSEVSRAFDAEAWTVWLSSRTWTLASAATLTIDVERSTPEGIELVPMVNGVHGLSGISVSAPTG